MIYVYLILIVLLITLLIVLFLSLKDKNKRNSNQFVQAQIKTILDTMNQAILLFNNKGKLLFYNEDAQILLNLNEECLNLHFEKIFDNEKIRTGIRTLTKDKSFDLAEDGKIYAVNIYSVKEQVKKKEEISVVVTLKNVTERRTIEQTKKDFFSHASHELKSPLTAIVGYSELVSLNMVDESEYDDVFGRIYKQAMHMSVLVDEMATLSRLEAIPADENLSLVNLDLVLKETIDTLEPFILVKNITLNLDVESFVFRALSLDMNKLFKNLIENSIKYSQENTNINITLKLIDGKVIFIVEDEGMGIAPEHQQSVFERFYRVDKGRLESGTGLGLAIVKHIAIKYLGKVKLESKLGVGTKITVELPVIL